MFIYCHNLIVKDRVHYTHIYINIVLVFLSVHLKEVLTYLVYLAFMKEFIIVYTLWGIITSQQHILNTMRIYHYSYRYWLQHALSRLCAMWATYLCNDSTHVHQESQFNHRLTRVNKCYKTPETQRKVNA